MRVRMRVKANEDSLAGVLLAAARLLRAALCALALSSSPPTLLASPPQGQPAGGPPADAGKPGTVSSKDGTRIAFERTGDGPVLVLVPAALSRRADIARLAALLAGRFSVIAYDRRGRGDSGDTAPYALAREVEDLEAVIDAAGGSACLFGHSSGAVLALEAASRIPTKVAKQVLFEPPFIVDKSRPPVPADFVEHVAQLIAAGRRGDAVETFMVEGVGVPREHLAGMRALPMWPDLESLAHTLVYDLTLLAGTQAGEPLPPGRWATAHVPTLVLDGGRSPAWLRAAADALADALPHAQRSTVEGQDHSAAVMAPQSLAPLLTEFLLD